MAHKYRPHKKLNHKGINVRTVIVTDMGQAQGYDAVLIICNKYGYQ